MGWLEPLRWILAIAGAVAIELYWMAQTLLTSAKDYPVGAPLAVGNCHADALFSPANTCSYSPLAFAADVAIIAAVILLASWRSGALGALVAGLVGSLVLRVLPGSQPDDVLPRWIANMALLAAAGVLAGPLLRWRPRRIGSPA